MPPPTRGLLRSEFRWNHNAWSTYNDFTRGLQVRCRLPGRAIPD